MEARLAGLEEKFRIVNNDELADALRVRLDELSMRPTSWMPEVLSMFLQLSDRPAQNSRIEDVEFSHKDVWQEPLTWTQILDCDLLDNQHGLWDNVDFAANESEEDYSMEIKRSQSAESISNTSSCHGPGNKLLELSLFVQQLRLNEKIASHLQRPSVLPVGYTQGPVIKITESQLVKESLFMLRNLPTFMYVICESGRILYSRRYCAIYSPGTSITNLLGHLADMGTQLSLTRKWIQKPAHSPLQQTFQAALAVRMTKIDRELSLLEANALNRKNTITLSSTNQDVLSVSRYMLKVAELMQSVSAVDESLVSFKILELLYDASCLSQSIGDIGEYAYMAHLFLECFLTYLKPVAKWMEKGELPQWRHAFFISRNEKTVGADFFWRHQFALHHTREGNLLAPDFLHSLALKILNTGKIVNFQRKLGWGTSTPDMLLECASGLDVNVQEESKNLRPFSELFHVALSDWIDCRYRISSASLRQHLTVCGLQSSLDALEYIFFCKNGFLTGQIVSAISDRLDRCSATWNDRSALTGLFRSIFGALSCVDAQRITVRSYDGVLLSQNQRKSVAVLGSFSVHYPLAWSVANILQPESAGTYQRILTILMQVQWAKYLLEGQRFTSSSPILSRSYDGAPAFLLRHRLLWFTNLIFTYLSDVVLSPSTSQLRSEITKATDIDEMVAAHEIYLVRLEDRCLLSQKLKPVYQAVMAMFDVAIGFAELHSILRSQTSTRQDNTTAVYGLSSDKSGNRNQEIISSSKDSQAYDGQRLSADVGNPTFGHPRAYLAQLNKFHQDFKRLHSFVLAGLRAVHRVSNESCWEILADLLTYGTGRNGKDFRDDS